MQRKTEEKDRKQKKEKVEQRNRKRLKRIGSEKTKTKKYMFHLRIDSNKGKKVKNDGIEFCTIMFQPE